MLTVCLTLFSVLNITSHLRRGEGGQGTWQEATEQTMLSDPCLEPCLLPGWEGGPREVLFLPASLAGRPRRVELLARARSTADSQECGVVGSLLWQRFCFSSPSLLVAPDPVTPPVPTQPARCLSWFCP